MLFDFKKILFILCCLSQLTHASERQMILSVSSIVGEDESRTVDLSFGSQVFKNGFLEFSGTRTLYEGVDGEEESVSGGGLYYGHDINRYFSIGLSGFQARESEYLNTKDYDITLSLNINSLWNSYYLTTISYGGGNKKYIYFQETVNIRDIDIPFDETRAYIGISHEFNDYVSISYRYTKFEYDHDPNIYPDTYPLITALLFEFSSMIYGFLDHSEAIALNFHYEKFALRMSAVSNLTLIRKEEEEIKTLSLGYSFKWFDTSIIVSENTQPESSLKSSGLELNYYF